MASIKNLLIRLGVIADDVDGPVERTARGLRKVADQAERTERSVGGLHGRFDSFGSIASRLGGILGGLGGALGGVAGGIGVLASKFIALGAGAAAAGVKLIAGAAALATLSAALAATTYGTVGLVAAIAPVGGLLAALPGIALVGASAFGAWKLATAGLGEAMGAVLSGNAMALAEALAKLGESGRAFLIEFERITPQLKEFQKAVQDAFLAELGGRLAGWAAALDALKLSVAGVAAELGGIVRAVLDVGTSAHGLGRLDEVLRSTSTLLDAIRVALGPLITGFLDLGAVGARWLASLSGGLTDSLTRFGQWMSAIASGGQAWKWMDGAALVLKSLGTILIDLGGAFAGFLRAAESAGVGALGVLSQLVAGMHAWVDSAQGQQALVAVFVALRDITTAFLPAIQALAVGVGALAPTIGALALAIGPILTTAINGLAPALAALGPGLQAALGGLGQAVAFLQPLLLGFGRALSDILAQAAPLLPAVAEIASIVAGVLVDALHSVVPAVVAFTRALLPVLRELQGGAVDIFRALGQAITALASSGALEQLGRALGGVLSAAAPLLPMLADIAAQVIQSLTPALPTLAGAATQVVGALLPLLPLLAGIAAQVITALAPALSPLASAFVGIVTAAAPLLPVLAGLVAQIVTMLAPILPPLATAFIGVLTALTPLVPVIAQIVAIVGQLATQALANLAAVLAPVVAALADALRPALESVSGALARILPLMTPLYEAFGQILAAVVTELLPPILALIPALMDALVPAFIELTNALLPLTPMLTELAIMFVRDVMPSMIPLIPMLVSLTGKIAEFGAGLSRLVEQAKPYIEAVVKVFQWMYDVLVGHSIVPDLANALRSWFNKAVQWITDAINGLREIPGRVAAWFGDMKDRAVRLAGELVTWVQGLPGRIANAVAAIGELPGRFAAWFGQMKDGAIARALDLVNWLRGLPGTIMGVFNNLGGMLGTIGHNMVIGLWNGFVNAWNSFMGMLGNLFSGMVNWLRGILGIASPSRVFASIGKQLPAGLAAGMDRAVGLVESAANRMAEAATVSVVGGLTPAAAGVGAAVSFAAAPAPSGSRAPAGDVTVNLTINGADIDWKNVQQTGREILHHIREGLINIDKEQM